MRISPFYLSFVETVKLTTVTRINLLSSCYKVAILRGIMGLAAARSTVNVSMVSEVCLDRSYMCCSR
jgi:hypothetical protein